MLGKSKKTTKKKEVNHANIIIDHFPFFYHKTEERNNYLYN